MTDNLPATQDPSTALARNERPVAAADVDGWTQVVGQVAKLADHIAGTPFVPKDLRGSAASVAAAILYGREVGLPPMTALTQTHVIEGKPAASAEAMRALVIAQGHDVEVVEASGHRVVMRARRRGSETWTPLEWNIDMARAAGLVGKDNWRKYPRSMLLARCSAELIRMVFPDVIHGLRAVEELDEVETPTGEQTALESAPAKVSRTRKTTSRARKTAAAAEPPAPAPEPGGMPLPGEDGYDEEGGSKAPPAGVEESAPPAGEPVVERVDAPTQDNDPEREKGTPDEEVVDGELVEGGTADGPLPEVPEESYGPDAVELPEPEVEQTPPPRAISKPQQRMILARLSELGLDSSERDERLRLLSSYTGRELSSGNDLTRDEASSLIDTLGRVSSLRELLELVEATETARRERSS